MIAPRRNGYAVEITREDGSNFLAAGSGFYPQVWSLSRRSSAVAYKRSLAEHGLASRVVRVEFYDPEKAVRMVRNKRRNR